MRFYNQTHEHYCGIDLQVKTMYVWILDAAGKVLVHRSMPSTPEAFCEVVAPYRQGLVAGSIGVGCRRTVTHQSEKRRLRQRTPATMTIYFTG